MKTKKISITGLLYIVLGVAGMINNPLYSTSWILTALILVLGVIFQIEAMYARLD